VIYIKEMYIKSQLVYDPMYTVYLIDSKIDKKTRYV